MSKVFRQYAVSCIWHTEEKLQSQFCKYVLVACITLIRNSGPCWAGSLLFPLVHLLPHLLPFLLFSFFYWLYLFSSIFYPFFLPEQSHSVSRPEVVASDRTWVQFVVFNLCYLYSLVKVDSGVLFYLVQFSFVCSFSALTCWLGHLTRKNPSITYNVFGGPLNLTQSINQSINQLEIPIISSYSRNSPAYFHVQYGSTPKQVSSSVYSVRVRFDSIPIYSAHHPRLADDISLLSVVTWATANMVTSPCVCFFYCTLLRHRFSRQSYIHTQFLQFKMSQRRCGDITTSSTEQHNISLLDFGSQLAGLHIHNTYTTQSYVNKKNSYADW